MLVLVILLAFLACASCNKTIDFLTHYGYLKDNALATDITYAVKQFQETYGLESTGLLDNATLTLMSEPRCGHKDNIRPFAALPNRKWFSNVITWYQYGSPQYPDIIQKAFDVWSKHANITFKKDFKKPTIIISLSDQRQHVFYSRNDICPYDFDGPGLVLGHAYLPTSLYNQTDIHMDSEENWDFTMDLPRNGNVSFFLTMVHEIGHTLGLDHSSVNDSVMFPYNRTPRGISSLNEYGLSRDDQLAIQFLYGTKSTTTTTTTTTPPPTTATTTTITEGLAPVELYVKRDICNYKNQINTYFIYNKRVYAFLNDYVWILNLNPAKRAPEESKTARKITDWLQFLPRNFTGVSAIHQRPNGDIALFTGTDVYLFRFPSLSLINKFNVNSIANRAVHRVNAVFSTYNGKTFMIIDDWYLIEISQCSLTGSFMGMVSSNLYGVPGKVNGAFRYINGNIYFMTDSGVLEFNEYTNAVSQTVSDAFKVLEIPCVRETLLSKLYEVVRYLQ